MRQDVPFNPERQGRAFDQGPRRSTSPNWANTIDTAPFHGYQVTCGLTFTFGGLRITEDAQVLDVDMVPIKGLYAAGEIVGGIFYFNYPGGSGLINGAVFGRIAGHSAAAQAGKALAADVAASRAGEPEASPDAASGRGGAGQEPT